MTRDQILLARAAAGRGRSFTPAQLQKAAFLVSRNLPSIFDANSTFRFEPYDYGPFDRAVYLVAETLETAGLLTINRTNGSWRTYCANSAGLESGLQNLERLTEPAKAYIQNVVDWVLSLSFAELVRSIYESYPDMRVNSIFRDKP